MNKILIIIFSFLIIDNLYPQASLCPNSNLELIICNKTSNSISLRLFPVSAIINGNNILNIINKNRLNTNYPFQNFEYLNGVYRSYITSTEQIVYDSTIIPSGGSVGFNGDYEEAPNTASGCIGNVSYGIYKLILRNLTTNRIDSAIIDYDYYYFNGTASTPGDLNIVLENDNSQYRFWYLFRRSVAPLNFIQSINYIDNDYHIKTWRPNQNNITNKRSKEFGPESEYFVYKKETNPIYNIVNHFPIDGRRDCGIYPSVSIYYNQNFIYPNFDEIQLHNLNEERHGEISLNLKIMKYTTTPLSRWEYSQTSTPTNISILPEVKFTIDKGQTGNATTYTEFLLKNYSDGTGTKFIVNGNNEEFSGATLKLIHSDVYETNARMRFQQDCELVLKPQSNTILEKYVNLIFENGGEMYMEQNSNITFYDHGEIIINSGGKVYNCGANITNNSNVCIIAHQGGQYFVGSQYCNSNITHTFNDGAFLVLNGGDLFVADNSKLIFDGSNSFLNAKPNSHIYLGTNSKLEFKNGAYLKAENVTLNSITNEIWEGLLFENAGGQTEIKNCTFTNAKNPIKIINDSASAYSDKKIIGNTFNMPAVTGNGIYAENVFKVLIQNNTFNLASPSNNQFGIYIRNNYNAGYPNEEAPMPLYQLNILSNSFSSGTIGMALMNTAGIMIPFYVFDNRFTGTSNSYYGIIGRKITGDIKNTKFTNTNINQGIRLDLCNVNLYNNEV